MAPGLSEEAGHDRQWTAITLAVVQGDGGALRAAISSGIPINHQDAKDDTALHYAVWGGRDDLIPILLAAGADPNLANHRGQSPLHHACARRAASVMAALLASGGDLGFPDSHALTPLMAIARPPPAGLRSRRLGPLSEDVLDLVVEHVGAAFWLEPVGHVWRATLAATAGEEEAARVWASLEAKGLRRLLPAGPARGAAPRRL